MLSDRTVVVDIGLRSLKLLAGDRGCEIAIERTPRGRLTDASRELAGRELRAFVGRVGRAGRRALCGLPARGISLRRFSLPGATPEELEALVALGLERDLPMPPEEFVWGYRRETAGTGPAALRGGAHALVDVLVACGRREIVEEYDALLKPCGLAPAYTLGILAAARLCRPLPGTAGILDIGKAHAEFLLLEDGKPRLVRTLSWGGETVTGHVSRVLSIPARDAEERKRAWSAAAGADGDGVARAAGEALRELAKLLAEAWSADLSLNGSSRPHHIYLAGKTAFLPRLSEELAACLSGETSMSIVAIDATPGRSAVTMGLAAVEDLPLEFRAPARRKEPGRAKRSRGLVFWIAAAILLAAASLALRYVVPMLRIPEFASKFAAARAYRDALPSIDRELEFLEFLEANQVAYLDAFNGLAAAAAEPGAIKVNQCSLNRQGELLLDAMTAPGKANELRGKLARSGFFTRVTLLEESPSKKDKDNVEFRLSARFATHGTFTPIPPPSPPSPAAKEGAPAGESAPPAAPIPPLEDKPAESRGR